MGSLNHNEIQTFHCFCQILNAQYMRICRFNVSLKWIPTDRYLLQVPALILLWCFFFFPQSQSWTVHSSAPRGAKGRHPAIAVTSIVPRAARGLGPPTAWWEKDTFLVGDKSNDMIKVRKREMS